MLLLGNYFVIMDVLTSELVSSFQPTKGEARVNFSQTIGHSILLLFLQKFTCKQ
jgi:hypothetical protein